MKGRAFVEYLLREGTIASASYEEVTSASAIAGDHGDTAVLELGLASEAAVLEKLGRFTNSRTVSAAELAFIPPETVNLISTRVARRFGVVPFFRDGKTLHVAALDPGDFLVQDELALLTGCMITTFAVLEVRLKEALARYYGARRTPQLEALAQRLSGLDSGRVKVTRSVEATVPVVRPEPPKPSLLERHREESAKRREATVPTELEISEEDLALFPSMAVPTPGRAEEKAPLEADPPRTAPPAHDEAAEDDAAPSPIASTEEDIEVRMAYAAEALQRAEMRDDIADVLLDFCTPHLERRMLLTLRGENIVGWRGDGPGVEPAAVRAIAIPKTEPSVFLGLLQGTEFWLGPLPPMPRNQEVLFAIGDPRPQSCLILPIKVRGKVVAFLYGDQLGEPLGNQPMAQLRRLLSKADVAFQVYLLKAKIRTL